MVFEKTHWPFFNQVFMVWAKMNEGVEERRRYLFAREKPGPWLFSRNLLTDQMPQDLMRDQRTHIIAMMSVLNRLNGLLPGAHI